MSKIYSLPLTNILVNGTRTYRIRTRDYDDVLQHVEVESKTNDTINLNFEDLYFESIAFKGGSDLGETTLKCIRNTMDVKNYYTVDSRPITCSDELKEEYLAELQFLVSRGYLIDIPVPIFKDIKLDLNHQWRRCQNYQSPLEGWVLYESASNWHVGGASAICYLNIVSNDAPLVMYYCSYAENQFDWLNIGFPDGTGVDTLRTSQQPPTSLSRMSIVEKDATMTGVCTITYQKDGSVDSGDDRGYILIPNDIPFINEYVEPVPEPVYIDMISIAGPTQITEPGNYDFQAGIVPPNADTYDLGWDIKTMPSGVDAGISYGVSNPKQATLTVNSISPGTDVSLVIKCFDVISGVSTDYAINIKKEADPIHIQNITISGPSQITEPGTYDYHATISPDNADEYDIDWSFVGSFSEPHLSIQTDPDDPLHCQLIVATPESSFGAAFAIECEDTISYNYDRFSVVVDVYVEPPVPVSGNIYYSWDQDQYVLDKETDTWIPKTWNIDLDGAYIWTDGDNIYYSNVTEHYILDKETDTWLPKTWNITVISSRVWTDGTNVYHSYSGYDYVLDKETDTWIPKTWNWDSTIGIAYRIIDGTYIWTDGTNIYHSDGRYRYFILDKETDTWMPKNWNMTASTIGYNVWTDGTNTYYSDGTLSNRQYILDKETGEWKTNTTWSWQADARYIWTDGTNTYYSNSYRQYILDKETGNWVNKTWYDLVSGSSGTTVWSDNPGEFAKCQRTTFRRL